MITSLSAFAKINEFGFIETPYRIVRDHVVTEEIEYMTADQEERCIIAQASAPLDKYSMFKDGVVWARYRGEPFGNRVRPHHAHGCISEAAGLHRHRVNPVP